MNGPEGAIELFHGYTYSAHPVACAAALAAQRLYRAGLFGRAREMAPYWSDAAKREWAAGASPPSARRLAVQMLENQQDWHAKYCV